MLSGKRGLRVGIILSMAFLFVDSSQDWSSHNAEQGKYIDRAPVSRTKPSLLPGGASANNSRTKLKKVVAQIRTMLTTRESSTTLSSDSCLNIRAVAPNGYTPEGNSAFE